VADDTADARSIAQAGRPVGAADDPKRPSPARRRRPLGVEGGRCPARHLEALAVPQ